MPGIPRKGAPVEAPSHTLFFRLRVGGPIKGKGFNGENDNENSTRRGNNPTMGFILAAVNLCSSTPP